MKKKHKSLRTSFLLTGVQMLEQLLLRTYPQGTGHSMDRLQAVDHCGWRRERWVAHWAELPAALWSFSELCYFQKRRHFQVAQASTHLCLSRPGFNPPITSLAPVDIWLCQPCSVIRCVSVESLKGPCLEVTVFRAVFEARLLLHQVDKMVDLHTWPTLLRFHYRDSKLYISSFLQNLNSPDSFCSMEPQEHKAEYFFWLVPQFQYQPLF